jgi:hypothetical protein
MTMGHFYQRTSYAVVMVLALASPFGALAQTSQEREIQLQPQLPPSVIRDSPLEAIGLRKLDIAGLRISAFLVGSFSYNSGLQMVPDFAGGAPALADPGSSNFRFDKFGLSVAKTFAPWLSASASMEVENHRDRHTHLISPSATDRLGCPVGQACERFGAEEAETEINLDKFNLTGVAPLGNGLSLSIGRFDVPFGIERHDEPLLLTATTSEVFRFGRPDRMTGFQIGYPFAPWLDVSTWIVNRWENEVTGEEDFNDNNRDKSFGGRIGFTPVARDALLNFGIGGFYGPEQDDNNSNKRWVLDFDFTWSPLARLLFAGEIVYGGESNREMRERGIPVAAPEEVRGVHWWGTYVLASYDFLEWLGFAFRYGYFDDIDGGRTGVKQILQSWTFVPILHLSRLIPDLAPTGAAFPRSRTPIDWVNLKLEYRLNHSNKPVFSDTKPGNAILEGDKTSHQVQLQVVVNF